MAAHSGNLAALAMRQSDKYVTSSSKATLPPSRVVFAPRSKEGPTR